MRCNCASVEEHQGKGAESVSYELRQMRDLVRDLCDEEQFAKYPAHIRRALIEAFLAHVRCLREFFTARKSEKYPDTLSASEYNPSWKPPAFSEHGSRLHKRLAHISCERQTLSEKWYPQAVAGEIEKVYSYFYDRLGAQPLMQSKFEPPHALPKGEVFGASAAISGPARDTTSHTSKLP